MAAPEVAPERRGGEELAAAAIRFVETDDFAAGRKASSDEAMGSAFAASVQPDSALTAVGGGYGAPVEVTQLAVEESADDDAAVGAGHPARYGDVRCRERRNTGMAGHAVAARLGLAR